MPSELKCFSYTRISHIVCQLFSIFCLFEKKTLNFVYFKECSLNWSQNRLTIGMSSKGDKRTNLSKDDLLKLTKEVSPTHIFQRLGVDWCCLGVICKHIHKLLFLMTMSYKSVAVHVLFNIQFYFIFHFVLHLLFCVLTDDSLCFRNWLKMFCDCKQVTHS